MPSEQPQDETQAGAQTGGQAESGTRAPGSRRAWLKRWIAALPGTRKDYVLLSLAALDIVLVMSASNVASFLPRWVSLAVFAFDIFVLTVWGIDFLIRLKRSENRFDFAKTHWYEIVGLLPLQQLRWFLLLRAAKFAIAFYKFGKSEQRVSRLLTKELTFRFRDVIVDTISDAVFRRSLERVDEVMARLDYEALAREVMNRHARELQIAVREALNNKSIVGELRRVPFMGPFANRVGDEVGEVVGEILETRVLGEIMKDISANILVAMDQRLRALDVERITTGKDTVPRFAGLARSGPGPQEASDFELLDDEEKPSLLQNPER